MSITSSFIISYYEYTDKDKENLKRLLEYLSWFTDNKTEIVLVEQGFQQQVDWLKSIKNSDKINYIFLKSHKIFNKGWGYNVGVKNAKGKYIILHDTDAYLRIKTYRCLWMLDKFDIIKPYKFNINLDENDSKKFLVNYNFNVALRKKVENNINIAGGVLMINKDKYLSIKGFDETIVSYNYQKVAFDIKVNKFKLSVNHYNDSALFITKDNIFLSKDIFQNDKYLCYLYNDLDMGTFNIIMNNVIFGENEIFLTDYDSYILIEPISIIITAYQTHKYIEECLDSVENQSYFKYNNNFEVLLGIDNCEDTLNEVIKIKHKYRNLKVFMMKENKGTYVASNTLINNAKYENILRFDSDDVMHDNMIKDSIPHLKKYNLIRYKFIDIGKKNKSKRCANGVILFKKELFKELGGFQPWKCSADTEFLTRGKEIINEKQLYDVIFYRRIHDKSLSTNYDKESNVRKKYHNLIGKHENIKIKKITNKFDII